MLIIIFSALRTSILSATELIGLFFGSKFLILISVESWTIFDFHLLGKKGLIGEIESFFEFRLKIGPWTDRLYAVLPAGVETKPHLKLIY